jgi:hypothetical protein
MEEDGEATLSPTSGKDHWTRPVGGGASCAANHHAAPMTPAEVLESPVVSEP